MPDAPRIMLAAELSPDIPCYRIALVRQGNVEEFPEVYVHTPEDAYELLRNMQSYPQECMEMLALNAKNRVIARVPLSIGALSASIIEPRALYGAAIALNAKGVVLAHNHPSGDPSPSKADIKVTEALVRAGEEMRVLLVDHIIIGKNDFVSLEELGKMSRKVIREADLTD